MARTILAAVAVLVFTGGLRAAETSKLRFSFGATADGVTHVSPDTVYSAERAFGFEPGASVTSLDGGAGVTSAKPFLFSARVPEGNYRVTVTLGDPVGESNNTI